MANTNSTEVSNRWASPRVANTAGTDQGKLRIKQGSVEVTAANFDADGDTIRLCELPSNAAVKSIMIGCDDVDGGSNTAFNVGLYNIGTASATLGSIVDEDCYASAVTYGQTAQALTEVQHEAAPTNLDRVGQKVFLDGDSTLTADPNVMYELVLTQTHANVSGMVDGTYAYQVVYAID